MVLFLIFLLCASLHSQLVITEVSPNPVGGSSEVPGDLSHEFIEFYNSGPEAVNLCRCYIKSGSWGSTAAPDSNDIQVWQGDSLRDIGCGSALVYDSLLPPGGYAVLLGRKYVSAPESTWYRFPAGTRIYATRKTYLRSGGLANASTWVTLFAADRSVASKFNGFGGTAMDPGEGFTWHRVNADSSDAQANWRQALSTPGAGFSIPVANAGDTAVIINEFMCDPAEGGAEWVELHNRGNDTVSLQGWRIRVGGAEGFITLSNERILPKGYAIVREPGTFTDGFFDDCLSPVLVAQNWDGLRRDADEIVIRNSRGEVMDSLHYEDGWFAIKKGGSLERTSEQAVTNAGSSWRHSAAQKGATPGYANSASLAGPAQFSFAIADRRIIPGSSGRRASLIMSFNAPSNGKFTLKIFDLKGRLVRALFSNTAGVAERSALWDGLNGEGKQVPAGVYLVYCHYADNALNHTRKIAIALGRGNGAE